MPRSRPLAAIAVVAAVLLGSGAPLSARAGHGSPTNPTASDETPPSSTSTTLPPGIDVGHGGDQSGAAPPDADIQVEPADPDNVNEVLRISAAEAQERRDAIRADLDEVIDRIGRLDRDLRAFGTLSADLVVQQRIVAHRAVAARRQLMDRAVGAYVSGNTPDVAAAYAGGDPNEAQERSAIVRTILEADERESDRLLARRLDITARLSRVLEQAEQTEAELRVAKVQRQDLTKQLDRAQFALDVFDAGGDIVITGFVFPVADPHTFSSTFGSPRSGGRSHEGNDIFAPMGTPVLASERGVVANVGVGTLGGTKLWVYGESGTQYYYAHLIAYADGVVEGTEVEAGQVVGYVGNTGNAITTPPHLHYEIHPGGGEAMDPYPLLHAVDVIDGRHVLPNLYDEDPDSRP
jgi:murein DD-endopeptidase MepM/ murein hydrolase activator NlpD